MSEYREDRYSGNVVLVAPERAHRPGKRGWHQAGRDHRAAPDKPCPFCPGQESLLPEIIQEATTAAAPGWTTRVVPNRYPALTLPGGSTLPDGSDRRAAAGFGCQEVIIETPRHDADIATLTGPELACVLRAYRDRYLALAARPYARSVVLFRNHGGRAGTSLMHPHAQIAAMDRVPPRLAMIAEHARGHYKQAGDCSTCRQIVDIAADGRQLVKETPGFLLVVPYAAASPFELAILPRRHSACFGRIDDTSLLEFGDLLQWSVTRLRQLLDDPPYNLVLDSFLAEGESADYLHWRLSIVPRLVDYGGFELATGLTINPSNPEADADILRAEPVRNLVS